MIFPTVTAKRFAEFSERKDCCPPKRLAKAINHLSEKIAESAKNSDKRLALPDCPMV